MVDDPPSEIASNAHNQASSPAMELPVELWRHIFDQAIADIEHRDPRSNYRGYRWDPYYTSEDFDNLECFPYSCAATCSLWRDILLAMPKAWQRIIVLLNHDDPAMMFKLLVSRLGTLKPRSIHITRRGWFTMLADSPNPTVDPREESKIRALLVSLAALDTEMLESLSIRTISGDSLPSILHFGQIQLPRLHTLELDSILRGTGKVVQYQDTSLVNYDHDVTQNLSILEKLTVTGRNFVDIQCCGPWIDWYHGSFADGVWRHHRRFGANILRVSHFCDSDGRETDDFEEYTVVDFFNDFLAGRLPRGEIYNMDCDFFRRPIARHNQETPILRHIQFDRSTQAAIQAFVHYIGSNPLDCADAWDGATLEIRSCSPEPMGAWPRPISIQRPLCENLVLRDMEDERSVRAALKLAPQTVQGLWVTNCTGFNDGVVSHLGESLPTQSTSAIPERRFPKLRAIYITDCPHLDLHPLRELVDELNGTCDEQHMSDSDEEDVDVEEIQMDEDEDSEAGDLEAAEDEQAATMFRASDALFRSSQFEGVWADFVSGIAHDRTLDLSPEDQQKLVKSSYSDGYYILSPQDPVPVPPDAEDSDLESCVFGPQFRHIQVSGRKPPVSEEDVSWFASRGVHLETV